MCALLYWAAGCSLVNYGGMASFHPTTTLSSGEKMSLRGMESMYNGHGMRALENGAMMLDFSGPVADKRPPIEADLEKTFPNGMVTRNGKIEQVRPWLYGNWYKSAFAGRKQPLMIGLGIRLGTSGKIEDSVDREHDTINLRGSYLRYRTDKETNFIPGRLRASDSGSPYAFSKLRSWLSICDQYHPCLSNDHTKPLPTRVLHCPSDRRDMVFLRETAGETSPYLALSHRWGTTHRLTLTKANLSMLQSGIMISDLPKTFQDAVTIAWELDVPYLWIDSLCIIQNDAADWEKEASHMGDVYANAYLTIAALASKDDSSGCFPDPATRYDDYFVSADVKSTGRRSFFLAAPVASYDEAERVPTLASRCHWATDEVTDNDGSHISWLYMTPEWMPPSSSKGRPKQYLIGEFGGEFDPIADEPLSDRGWTLQERLLSPRTIHYGRAEMYWECQCCVIAEDGAMFRRKFTAATDLWLSEPREPGKTRQWRWTRLVEEFSKRKLTKDFDKLPALSGLANLIAANTGDTYLAGLWKSTLMTELSWSVKAFEPHHSCDDPKHDASMPAAHKSTVKYPSQYRAPSWSWASIDAEIDYIGSNSDGERLASLIDVSVKALGKDPFGRLASGRLVLKAPLYDLTPQELTGRTAISFPLHAGVLATWSWKRRSFFGMSKSVSKVTKDGMALFDDTPSFPCKALFLTASNALVLKDLGNGKYNRIGSARFHNAEALDADKDLMPNGAVQQVEIV
ncbi:heterokaryon incompatibility protein-domain-containing protein [Paraphoma chrysanthemicola]|uniref:Heterokaryon incompatibility protein-domain-containing protein n=1 Tax=Paraphoma chrysanthemicola TaxID=798071 RepID=A0A8K0VU93_9PLEO|nr:heterokaryon incompatibility protein-domain-containing protein [Paraphoma chrysanthemicola]